MSGAACWKILACFSATQGVAQSAYRSVARDATLPEPQLTERDREALTKLNDDYVKDVTKIMDKYT